MSTKFHPKSSRFNHKSQSTFHWNHLTDTRPMEKHSYPPSSVGLSRRCHPRHPLNASYPLTLSHPATTPNHHPPWGQWYSWLSVGKTLQYHFMVTAQSPIPEIGFASQGVNDETGRGLRTTRSTVRINLLWLQITLWKYTHYSTTTAGSVCVDRI